MKNHIAICQIGCLSLMMTLASNCPAAGTAGAKNPGSTGPAAAKTHRPNNDPFVRGAARLQSRPEDCFTYYRLRPEAEIKCLAPFAARFQALPKTTVLHPTVRDGREVRVALQIVGDGRHAQSLVCIHGIMADHNSWRYLAGALGSDCNLWLVDMPGCGDSDAPHPHDLGPDGYSPDDLAERVLQAVTAQLAKAPADHRLVFMGHSFGGLVTLRAFSNPALRARYAETLRRVDGLVLLAPCDVVMSKPDPNFQGMADLPGAKVDLARGLGVLREATAKYLLESSCSGPATPREEVDYAAHILADSRHRHAFQAMLNKALDFDPSTRRPVWEKMREHESWYRHVQEPCRIIWGERDETLPISMGYKLAAQLPRASLAIVPGGMHSPVYECPQLYADLIRRGVAGFAGGVAQADAAAGRAVRIETISDSVAGLPGRGF